MQVGTVKLRHKRKNKFITVDAKDWSEDLGRFKYSDYERVQESHNNDESVKLNIVTNNDKEIPEDEVHDLMSETDTVESTEETEVLVSGEAVDVEVSTVNEGNGVIHTPEETPEQLPKETADGTDAATKPATTKPVTIRRASKKQTSNKQ